LENIEVTNNVTEQTNLGIIVGSVDGNISNIGVKNAKLSFKDGKSSQVASEYTLVGHKTENVLWEELKAKSSIGNGIYVGCGVILGILALIAVYQVLKKRRWAKLYD
jgi:hypothetical protein